MQEKNKRWFYLAVVSGCVCGVGNYFLGIYLAAAGMMGPSVTGPLGLTILLVYRGQQFIRNKLSLGTIINYNDSNWFTPQRRFKR